MTKKLSIDYTQFNKILKADVVRVYDLVNFFKKDEIDYDEHGNIFIGFKPETEGLPILVAHTDNVLGVDKEPVFDLAKRRIKGVKDGIGFDDKAGIMAIITLWHYFKEQKFRIIFPANEEIGGVGTEEMDIERYGGAKWILELDRKGNKDFIQTSGGKRLCSDEFAQKFLDMGFKKAEGVFTDVNVMKPNAPSVNMANISIAYYEPHSGNEYLDTVEFEKIIGKIAEFIEKDYDFEPDEPDGASMIYNKYGERFCCTSCMNEFEEEWKEFTEYK